MAKTDKNQLTIYERCGHILHEWEEELQKSRPNSVIPLYPPGIGVNDITSNDINEDTGSEIEVLMPGGFGNNIGMISQPATKPVVPAPKVIPSEPGKFTNWLSMDTIKAAIFAKLEEITNPYGTMYIFLDATEDGRFLYSETVQSETKTKYGKWTANNYNVRIEL